MGPLLVELLQVVFAKLHIPSPTATHGAGVGADGFWDLMISETAGFAQRFLVCLRGGNRLLAHGTGLIRMLGARAGLTGQQACHGEIESLHCVGDRNIHWDKDSLFRKDE